jgi:hypothetical protein
MAGTPADYNAPIPVIIPKHGRAISYGKATMVG